MSQLSQNGHNGKSHDKCGQKKKNSLANYLKFIIQYFLWIYHAVCNINFFRVYDSESFRNKLHHVFCSLSIIIFFFSHFKSSLNFFFTFFKSGRIQFVSRKYYPLFFYFFFSLVNYFSFLLFFQFVFFSFLLLIIHLPHSVVNFYFFLISFQFFFFPNFLYLFLIW